MRSCRLSLSFWLLMITVPGRTVANEDSQLRSSSVRKLAKSSWSPSSMVERFQIARAKFMEKLIVDYGSENVPRLFKMEQDGKMVSTARVLFESSPVSWDRATRKIAAKILSAQIEEKEQRFVWAAGGHSAAAGHGNLFNQSYTVVMEFASKDILKEVGIDLVARPYAMGGAMQGFELGSCLKEVYGMDVDLLTSDFGMTSIGHTDQAMMWYYRVGLLPNFPILVELNGEFNSQAKDAERRGQAAILVNMGLWDGIEHKMPDTAGKTQQEINAMPTHVRSYRCEDAFERGEPTCDGEKYTILPDDDPCNERKYRVSWHPGWKFHALLGNMMTLFLIELVDDALQVISSSGSDPKVLLKSIQAKEKEERALWPGEIPESSYIENGQSFKDIPLAILYENPNICHIAKLPSEIRYNGILTESDKKGPYDSYDFGFFDSYDQGLELADARSQEGTSTIPLAWDAGLRQSFCKNDILQIDFPDFFIATGTSYSKLVLPNPSEKSVYQLKEPLQGYILLCRAGCGWGCPDHTIDVAEYHNGKISMTVNGKEVIDFSDIGSNLCSFLKHEGGHKFEPNSDGLFEIRAKMNDSDLYARISSLIIW